MKVRKSNFELLRIVAIAYVIGLHYLTKGGIVGPVYEDISAGNIVGNLTEQFLEVCCNLFVLITGYFAVDGKWQVKKIAGILAQVFFYSLIIPVLLGAMGVIKLSELSFKYLTMIALPVEFEHYWYVTAYVGLFFLLPVLATAINNLPEKTVRYSIIGLLIIYGGFKSINPYQIPWDRYGEDLPWFICVALVGGYIKRYGLPFIKSFKKGLLLYVAVSLLGFVIKVVASEIMIKTGKMWYYADMTTADNYITVFIASVALFAGFTYLNFNNKWINILGAHSFGIYLLHNNVLIEDKWQHWLGIDYAVRKWWQPIHMIACVLIVIIVGTLVDIFRKKIFDLFLINRNAQNNKNS